MTVDELKEYDKLFRTKSMEEIAMKKKMTIESLRHLRKNLSREPYRSLRKSIHRDEQLNKLGIEYLKFSKIRGISNLIYT